MYIREVVSNYGMESLKVSVMTMINIMRGRGFLY